MMKNERGEREREWGGQDMTMMMKRRIKVDSTVASIFIVILVELTSICQFKQYNYKY